MKIIAFNGSPRKTWNTATLLQKVLDGAASKGAETELVHLYDLNYKGCVSCFACKYKDSPSYGRCAVRDDLKPVFERIEEADAIVLGSPIYLGAATGEMRSFTERLVFQYLQYTAPVTSLRPKKIHVGLLYTMNVNERQMEAVGYPAHLGIAEGMMEGVFGSAESFYCYDTYQFDDYSKVVMERFDPLAKKERREGVFPRDCERAFEMGVRLALGKN